MRGEGHGEPSADAGDGGDGDDDGEGACAGGGGTGLGAGGAGAFVGKQSTFSPDAGHRIRTQSVRVTASGLIVLLLAVASMIVPRGITRPSG